jgi:hypothetical protein
MHKKPEAGLHNHLGRAGQKKSSRPRVRTIKLAINSR